MSCSLFGLTFLIQVELVFAADLAAAVFALMPYKWIVGFPRAVNEAFVTVRAAEMVDAEIGVAKPREA